MRSRTLLPLLVWLGLVLSVGAPALGQDNAEAPAAPANATPAADPSLDAVDPAPDTAAGPGDPAVETEVEVVGSVTLVERLEAGGWTMVFLAICSLVALAFSLERLFGLRRSVVAPPQLASRAMKLWESKDYRGIERLCDQHPSTMSTILKSFVRHRNCPTLELSLVASDIAGRDMRQHLQRAYPIAIAATLAPLLGLLGTVIGMIESFEVVSIVGSMGDASALAGSISKALVTTATGLVIAVPALAAYHVFKTRSANLSALLEQDVNEVLTTWFMDVADAESPAEAKASPASAKTAPATKPDASAAQKKEASS